MRRPWDGDDRPWVKSALTAWTVVFVLTAFVPFWSEGKDSFESDPPNADISIVDGKTLKQTVVELQDPALDGNTLTYTVKILQGDMPVAGTDVAVFIDIIGRPLTPLSFAGVARRSYRRAVIY